MLDHATKPFADMVITGELIQAAIKSGRIRAQSSSKQEIRNKGEKKEKPNFTPIPIRYEELFPQLVESRSVAPRYIAPIQPPYPPWFNLNVKCDYHAGNPGHHIDNCTAFKYVVEQLLKAGMLSFETSEKNPMPNHKGVIAVIREDAKKVKENLAKVSAPLKWVWKRLVEHRILKTSNVTREGAIFYEFHGESSHVIQECVEFRRLIRRMMNSRELEFFEEGPDHEAKDVCALDESPTQSSFAGLIPLVIKVGSKSSEAVALATPGLVIKAPVPFPYKDSKQVPWKYECEVSGPQQTEENINEVGNFTRSGRCYSTQPNAEPRKNQKDDAPVDKPDAYFDGKPEPEYHEPVKEPEAKEFLKILKHSEYNVVEQLNKLPARISMPSLLLSSEPHRNALLKLLNQTFVPKEISIDMVDLLVGNISMDNFISFSAEEILEGVLIDNGSALNVLPLATLKKSPVDSTHVKAYHNVVRAFDEYEVDFVVMDIKLAYSCLLGRPWIHAAGAVPSTLHQKLKFVIDGKLVTVQAEEDIIVSVSTNAPYIEMDEDTVECSFRSLELVSATFVKENKVVLRPRLSRCAKMQVKQTLGKGAQIGRGFGKRLQGRLYPKSVKGKTDRFWLGYQPNRRERIAVIIKNKEAWKARLNGEDVPWDQMIFPPIGQSFVYGGLLDPEPMKERHLLDHNQGQFRDSSGIIDGNRNELSSLTSEDLSRYLEDLTINAVTKGDGENPYLGQVGPCPPGFKLNNWIAEELLVIFKSNTKFPNINGISNIVPDLQVDFEQNLSPEEFIDCEDEARCDLPNDLLRMMENEEK
ncbi:hypothetical protein V6N13_025473 [Hibiscus sabdariffa]